ncbi:MAG TPA: PRC-barrel domain-containing protein [Cyclobacteriaceae bacterium]|nr:PRC-barrel domain-containing protein [Cyclobacteriaceae bacterium]
MKTRGKSYEADNITGVNHEGPEANVPVERLTATSIIGDGVENMREENLGKIDNLMVNLRTGDIEYAIIEFGSFLGMGGKLFAIPFTEMKIDPAHKKFILNREKDDLKNIPGFDKDHWPDTNDHRYFDEVNSYWGTAYQV